MDRETRGLLDDILEVVERLDKKLSIISSGIKKCNDYHQQPYPQAVEPKSKVKIEKPS